MARCFNRYGKISISTAIILYKGSDRDKNLIVKIRPAEKTGTSPLFHHTHNPEIVPSDLYFFIDRGYDIDTTQGFDCRLIDEDVIDEIIRSTKDIIRIAFDFDNVKESVVSCINMFQDYGFDVRNRLNVYCYLHNDSDYVSCLKRVKLLKEMNTNAFVMVNKESKQTKRMKKLIHLVNRKHIYWSKNSIEDLKLDERV